MNNDKRRAIFERLRAANPAPTTELDYRNPFELLIAVILSAQATDVSVNKATGPLFEAAGTPTEMKALGLRKLKSYIKTIGLFNTKAANILKTCEMLLTQHGGEVPEDRQALEALPGVGRKTAERLALELKDKFSELNLQPETATASIDTPRGGIKDDAVSALVNLGYKKAQAEQALKKVWRDEAKPSLEELIRDSLNCLS